VLGLSGALGVLAGGFAADAGRARDPGAYMSVAVFGGALSGPLFATALLSPSGLLALAILWLPILLSSAAIAPVRASAQSVVRPRVRATAAATLTLGVNLVALGFGPLLVGALSDTFAAALGPAEGLRWALVVSCAACPLGALCFWTARRTLAADTVS
jgi:MFS family permease